MLKKIAVFILVNLLFPILREILTDLLKSLFKVAAEAFRSTMRKWERDETAKAESESERSKIQEKYASRQSDIDAVEEKLAGVAGSIVENALKEGENLRSQLLLEKEQELTRLESPNQGS